MTLKTPGKTQGFVFFFSLNRIHTIGRVLRIERGKILPFFFTFKIFFFLLTVNWTKIFLIAEDNKNVLFHMTLLTSKM